MGVRLPDEKINANLRQFANTLVIDFHRAKIFVLGMFLSADKKRHDPHAIGKETNEVYQRAGFISGFYDPKDSSPVGI